MVIGMEDVMVIGVEGVMVIRSGGCDGYQEWRV